MVLRRKYIQPMEVYGIFLVGTRKTCVTHRLTKSQFLISFNFVAGSGKSVLWFVLSRRFQLRETDMNNLVLRSYKISQPRATMGGPQWPISISTSGTSINKDFPTCFPLSSSNFLLVPSPVAIYSPDSILHTTVECGNPEIGRAHV